MKATQDFPNQPAAESLQMRASRHAGPVLTAGCFLVLASNAFAAWFVSQERSVYFWDFRVYWLKFANALMLLHTSLWQFASNLYWSVRGADYNDIAAYGLLPFGLIFGTSRLSFILAIVNLYAVPAMALFYLVWTLFARPDAGDVRRSVWIYVATVILSAPLWNPVLWGYVDIGGLIPAGIALLIYLTRPAHRYQALHILVLGFSLAIAVLFRRWYAFWSITFYLALGFDLLISAMGGRINRRDLARGLAKVAAAGVISSLVLVVLAYSITVYMLRTDYADLFSYMRSASSISAFFAMVRASGTLECLLFVVSAIYCLRSPVTRRATVLLLFQTALIIVLFLRTQDFDNQHLYLLQPVMLLCITTFIVAAARRVAGPAARVAVVAGYVMLIAAGFANAFLPQARTALRAFQRVLPAGHLPMRRNDFAEIERMVKIVEGQLGAPDRSLYVLADSEILNSDTVAFAPMSMGHDSPIRDRVYSTTSIDKRDGFPTGLFKATHIMVADPIQLIVDECQQRFVAVPARQILEGRGIGQRFTRLNYEFQLNGGVRAYLYERNAPISEEDRAGLVDEVHQPCAPGPKSN